jgi:serine/threonine protein kinase
LIGDKFYTERIDIWSASCIFAELLTGQVFFKAQTKRQESDPTKFNPNQISHITDILRPIRPDALLPSYEHQEQYTNLRNNEARMSRQGTELTVKVPRANANALNLQQQMLEYHPKKRIITVMNIAAQISNNEWREFVHQGKLNGTES